MNDEFEQFLAKQPLRPIPPEWRARILLSAESGKGERTEPGAPWWRALLWPSPIAWAGVLCAWVLIVGMNIASGPPAGDSAAAPAGAPPPDVITVIMQERQLVQDLSQLEIEPAEPPPRRSPSGACNNRRREEEMEPA